MWHNQEGDCEILRDVPNGPLIQGFDCLFFWHGPIVRRILPIPCALSMHHSVPTSTVNESLCYSVVVLLRATRLCIGQQRCPLVLPARRWVSSRTPRRCRRRWFVGAHPVQLLRCLVRSPTESSTGSEDLLRSSARDRARTPRYAIDHRRKQRGRVIISRTCFWNQILANWFHRFLARRFQGPLDSGSAIGVQEEPKFSQVRLWTSGRIRKCRRRNLPQTIYHLPYEFMDA